MYYPNDRVRAKESVWSGKDSLSGSIVKYMGDDVYWVKWDQDTDYARKHPKFATNYLLREEELQFEAGDRVTTRWDLNTVGTVIGVARCDSYRQRLTVEFDNGDRLCYSNTDLFVVKRAADIEFVEKEKMTATTAKVPAIALKPIQSEARIKGGNWTHVVINKESELAIAAFTSLEDAEVYINDVLYDDDDHIIREVA